MKKIFLSLSIISLIIPCHAQNPHETIIFKAHRAGLWYPAKPADLKKMLINLDNQAAEKFGAELNGAKICALISPHAGYAYSGNVAAAVYRLVDPKDVKKIIILAPSHFEQFNGIALPPFQEYKLPTGTIKIEIDAIAQLKESPLFQFNGAAFKPEHSVEMQLPMINYYMPGVPCIPLVVGNISLLQIAHIAKMLKSIIDEQTLIVVSSDFIHYGPRFNYNLFQENIAAHLQSLDAQLFQSISGLSTFTWMQFIKATNVTVCGQLPIALLLKLIELQAFGKVTAHLIGRATSADNEINQADENVVTYQGIIFTRGENRLPVNAYEKKSLLAYARAALENAFNESGSNDAMIDLIITPALRQSGGLFVTLYTINEGKKKLRGCIGRIASLQPIYETARDMALASAFEDTRFTPLEEKELPNILIEISLLTSAIPVTSYKDIILNKHGIILTQGNKSALFLPRVPAELGFDFETTLRELSLKAGLPADAWKDPATKYQIFESNDFEEK